MAFRFPRLADDFNNATTPTAFRTLAKDCLHYATMLYQSPAYIDDCVLNGPGPLLHVPARPPISLIPSPSNCDSFTFTPQLDDPTPEHRAVLAKFNRVSIFVDPVGVPILAGIYNGTTGDPNSTPVSVLMIAFRGSNQPHELVATDFNAFVLESANLITRLAPAQAHPGFMEYLRQQPRIDFLTSVLNFTHPGDHTINCKDMPVLFPGHSLGGAVSMLAAYNTFIGNFNNGGSSQVDTVGCITFGCPCRIR